MSGSSSELEQKTQATLTPNTAVSASHGLAFSSVFQKSILGALLFVAALAFNFYRLGVPSIWFDEAFSVELARQPLPLLWYIIFGPEPNMELYYLFLHFWLGLTGLLGLHATEFVVRFPSAVFAACSTLVVFLFGRRFMSTIAGVVGAGLYLLCNLQLIYAQQTRGYSLQLLLICVGWYALLTALTTKKHSWRWWACYVIVMTLALYTHLFTLLIIGAQILTIGACLVLSGNRAEKQRLLFIAGVSLTALGILVLPMLLLSIQGSKTGWLPIPHIADIYHLFLTITGEQKIYLLASLLAISFGILMVLFSSLPSSRQWLQRVGLYKDVRVQEQGKPFLLVILSLVCWLFLPILVSYIVSQGSTRLFSSRYLVTIVPPFFLLVGLGVQMVRWRTVQVVATILFLLIAVSCVHIYYESAQVEDWNSTSAWLIQHAQKSDGLVCYDNVQGCQISVEYYLHAYPSPVQFSPDSPGAYSWQKYGPVDPVGEGYDAAVDPNYLAVYGAKHPRLFFIVGRIPDDAAAQRALQAQHWLDSHYHFVDQIVTRTVTIRLYTT